jgi:hypothetical protein
VTSLRRILCLVATLYGAAALAAAPLPPLKTRPVALASNLKNGDRIGAIRILGMLEIPAQTVNGLRVAEFSDLAWDDDDKVLYTVTDQGALFGLRPSFKRSVLTAVSLVSAAPLREARSDRKVRWRRTDAEGLAIVDGRNRRKGDAEMLVSFEVEPRLVRYARDGTARRAIALPAPLTHVRNYAHPNLGLESLCIHPRLGPLVTPEQPLRDAPDARMRIFSLDGKIWTLDTPGRPVALSCTDAATVLILEREFDPASFRGTITLREARLPVKPTGRPVATRVLVTLDNKLGHAIDNFEGLAHHSGQRYFMVSDNNDLFLQRTLLLYFEIVR